MSLRTRMLVVAAAAALTSLAACASIDGRTAGAAPPTAPATPTAVRSVTASTPPVSNAGAAPPSYRFIKNNTAIVYRPGGHSTTVDLSRIDAEPNIGLYATISPDGRKIAYYKESTGRLALANIDGTHKVKTSIAVGGCDYPVWSPDSSRVLFTELSTHKIETINPDGTGRAVIESDAGCSRPMFSVDGSRIAFVKNGQVVLTDAVAGGGHRTIVKSAAKIETVLSVSADGHAIVSPLPNGGCGCVDGLRHWVLDAPNVLDFATGKLTPLTN